MNKEQIFSYFINELERRLNTLQQAALEAKEAATNEESKAENKYDTRGLEASYLAGAQAKRAGELLESIKKLKSLKLLDFTNEKPISNTALVHLEIDGEEERWFFISPCEGGIKIPTEQTVVYSLTLDSPLGKLLKGKIEGDVFDFEQKSQTKEYEILEVT